MAIDGGITVTDIGPEAFFSARDYSRDKGAMPPLPVPKSPGVYGWWFRQPPGAIDMARCEKAGRIDAALHRHQPVASTDERQAAQQPKSASIGFATTTLGTRKAPRFVKPSVSYSQKNSVSSCAASVLERGGHLDRPARLRSATGWPRTHSCHGSCMTSLGSWKRH